MAPWPFGSSPPPGKEGPKDPSPWSAYIPAGDPRQLVLPTALSTLGILGLVAFYRRFLRRIPGTAYIKPTAFRKRTLLGRVTSVGDGDGFHLYHTPGGRLAGWGWLRGIPKSRSDLKNQTVCLASGLYQLRCDAETLTFHRSRFPSASPASTPPKVPTSAAPPNPSPPKPSPS